MSTTRRSLAERHSDLSQQVILDAAVALLERGSVTDLSVRAVARQAGIAERTVFRHFATRDELLDGVAQEVTRRLELPPDPTSLHELLDYPKALFACFEAASALTKAVLHSELLHRVRSNDAERRGIAVRRLVDQLAPKRPERERKLATVNIRYHIIASTWHYYRVHFGLTLKESIDSAEIAVTQALSGLGVTIPGAQDSRT
jgi:AcrR family transcriptional regulator